MTQEKILVFDNYDSFTYNLVHAIESITGQEVDVYRNDKISLEEVNNYDRIILSPGPGLPKDAGIMPALIKKYAATKNILGVCLGHQAIAENFGGTLSNLKEVYHGIATEIKVIHSQNTLFAGLSESVDVGRYHSWVADAPNFPKELIVTAVDENGFIMACKHKIYRVEGVQFHPESILTPLGNDMLRNWLNNDK